MPARVHDFQPAPAEAKATLLSVTIDARPGGPVFEASIQIPGDEDPGLLALRIDRLFARARTKLEELRHG